MNVLGSNDRYFRINSNGNVWSPLSYEQLNQVYDIRSPILLDIEANEVVLMPKSNFNDSTSSTSQLIIVFEVDNQMPYFSQSDCIASINEHSAYLTSVIWKDFSEPQALDPDYGFNGTFKLNLIDNTNTFIISPIIGYRNLTFTLLVNDSKSLDYEKYHNLTVIVSDCNIIIIIRTKNYFNFFFYFKTRSMLKIFPKPILYQTD